MATAPKTTTKPAGTPVETGVPGPELWKLADTLRGNIDAAEYKHIVLPLMFLKYISDAFEELHQELESKADEGYDPEQPDEYAERNVFWVPMEARWSNIQSKARQEDIGATIDRAMDVIERENKPLQGVLPKNYGRDDLDKQVVGQVVDLVSNGGDYACAWHLDRSPLLRLSKIACIKPGASYGYIYMGGFNRKLKDELPAGGNPPYCWR